MRFGGVGMYINESLRYKVLEKTTNEAFQALWIEVQLINKKNIIVGVIYRQHNTPEKFKEYFNEVVEKYTAININQCT